jgi:hypothetical protein
MYLVNWHRNAGHFLSPKHLNVYLGEMTWRFNLREMRDGQRVDSLLGKPLAV